MYTRIKTSDEIGAMRVGGGMLASVLQILKAQLGPGMTTKQLADIAARELKALGGEPAFYNYQGFPDVICISVNDEVVHGIPGAYEVQNGDLVSLDFGVRYKGMITDGAITVVAGRSDDVSERIINKTRESLERGLSVLKDGATTGDVGFAIQNVLDKAKLGIVRDLVGHGVGHEVHEDPNIPNYGRKGTGQQLKSGMTLAIEPMATLGREAVYTDVDGWTVRTRDGSRAVHFEHTVLVTDDGCEILTLAP